MSFIRTLGDEWHDECQLASQPMLVDTSLYLNIQAVQGNNKIMSSVIQHYGASLFLDLTLALLRVGNDHNVAKQARVLYVLT